jgi:omega-amidase
MKVSILQYDNAWKDSEKNLTYVKEKLAELPKGTELLILSEMFTTGFTNDVKEVAETMSGLTLSSLKKWAIEYDLAICGSVLIEENGKYYNRFVFVKPDGEVATYDKRHLFTMGGEDKTFTAGDTCETIEYKGWKIKPQVCYDLRFPVWSRNTDNYDLLIYVSNWPKARQKPYEILLHARAIENQCYVCASNRIGVDGNNIPYYGNSLIIDAKGKTLASAEDEEMVLSFDLSKDELDSFRAKFPVLGDGDSFEV